MNTKNVYKIALCSVSYCFIGSKICTDDLSSKGIRAPLLKNSKWMMCIIIITMNWG